jgi:ATP-dependent Zn protease
VTILQRGDRQGYSSFVPDSEISRNKRTYLAEMDVALAGRVAIELVMGPKEVTTGCLREQQAATKMAYHYFRDMGMH